jgi:hypothetical protein
MQAITCQDDELAQLLQEQQKGICTPNFYKGVVCIGRLCHQ